MEKDRDTRIIAIVALIIGAIALSLGFASYTLDYFIENRHKELISTDEFKVYLSNNSDDIKSGTIEGLGSYGAKGVSASLDKNSIYNIKAIFSEPGQSVSYKFYAVNKWNYDAFLKVASFNPIGDYNNFKKCVAQGDTSLELVEKACEGINVSVKVGRDTFNKTNGNINGHILPRGFSEEIIVTISYDEGAERADGNFNVLFGKIGLSYASID